MNELVTWLDQRPVRAYRPSRMTADFASDSTNPRYLAGPIGRSAHTAAELQPERQPMDLTFISVMEDGVRDLMRYTGKSRTWVIRLISRLMHRSTITVEKALETGRWELRGGSRHSVFSDVDPMWLWCEIVDDLDIALRDGGLAGLVRNVRRHNHWTDRHLAHRLNVVVETIRKWEAGASAPLIQHITFMMGLVAWGSFLANEDDEEYSEEVMPLLPAAAELWQKKSSNFSGGGNGPQNT